jgi:hypothetical protein
VNPRLAFAWWGYCLPAVLSAAVLAEVRTGADVVSVGIFAAGHWIASRSPRWGVATGLGFLAGWSLGLGAAALAGIGVAIVTGLVTRAPIDDARLAAVVVPVAGAAGGAVSGTVIALVQLAGGRALDAGRWVRANTVGGMLAGVGFAIAFTSRGAAAAVVSVVLTGAAGMAWGLLAARAAEPDGAG